MPAAFPAPGPDPTELPTAPPVIFTHQQWRGSIYLAFGLERQAGTIPHISPKDINLTAAHFSGCLPYDSFEGDYSPGGFNGAGSLYAHVPPTVGYGITPAIVNRSIDLICAAGFLIAVRERRRGTVGRYRMIMPPGARLDLPALLEAAAGLGIKPTGRTRDTTSATAHRKARATLRREGVDDQIISGENPVDEDPPTPSRRSPAHDRPDGVPDNRPHSHGQHRPDGDLSSYRGVGEKGDGEGRCTGTTSCGPERRSGVRTIGSMPRTTRPYDDALLRWRDAPTA